MVELVTDLWTSKLLNIYKFICNFNQVLHTWLQQQRDDYHVKDLVSDLKKWIVEGYMETSVWKRLQNLITPDILPSFSERTELNQRSMSFENLAIGFRPEISGSTESTAAGTSMQNDQFTASLFPTGISTGIIYHLQFFYE